jgi:hypothetical protein
MTPVQTLVRRIGSYCCGIVLIIGMSLGQPMMAIAASAPPAPTTAEPITAPPRPTSTDIETSDISSEKINQFVRAYLQVIDLMERREAELQSAETESESRRIQHDIEAEAFALIEKAGLTRQEYLQLLGLANIDPEFGERIAIQLDEMKD